MANLFGYWWAIERARRVNDEIGSQRRQKDDILKALKQDLEKLETDSDFWALAGECAKKLQALGFGSSIELKIAGAAQKKDRAQALRLLKDEYDYVGGFFS